jgi:hypothetical protein
VGTITPNAAAPCGCSRVFFVYFGGALTLPHRLIDYFVESPAFGADLAAFEQRETAAGPQKTLLKVWLWGYLGIATSYFPQYDGKVEESENIIPG